MGVFCADTDYGIGLTSAGIVALRLLQVPPPDQVIWSAASIYYTRGDFSRVGDGFASIQWIWDIISISRLQKLLELLGGAEYKSLYIRSDKRDGTIANPSNSFYTFSAMMWKPVLSGQEGTPVVRTPYAMQTVKLQFIDAIEI